MRGSGIGDLHLRGLSKSFGAVRALTEGSLSASAGEVHALVGENGAGKSTMLRLLGGLLRPDAGTVEVDGVALELSGARDAARHGIRVVFQELSLLPDLTAAENLLLGDEPVTPIWTIRRRTLRDRARRVLDDCGIDDVDVGARVRDLPAAHRQKLEIAKALWREPRVLVLDEPTSMLTHGDSEWLLARARAAAARGAVVLFVSHRIGEIRAVADGFTVLRGGRDVARGRISEHTDDDLVRAMLGRDVEQLYSPPERTPGEVVLQIAQLSSGRLQGFTADIRRGEIVGVAALEGQGQRPLFMALAGAQRFDGEVLLEGRRYRPRTPRAALDAGVALVPEDRQSEGLLASLRVRENITLTTLASFRTKLRTIDRDREDAAAQAQIAELEVPMARLEDSVGVLSGGNQQKVIVARTLLANPKLLLLYDCTRGVDVGTKASLFALMEQLAQEGMAILFYSSDLSELVHMTHRTVVLAGQQVRAILEGPGLNEERILRAMIGVETPSAKAANP